jgi:cytidylate kinase
MIITIDGPAGTGKSSVAHAVAEQLGFDFLDTGAMYRAIGLAAIRRKVNFADTRELAYVAGVARIVFDFSQHPPALLLNGEPVSHLLRSGEATRAASAVAQVPAIRRLMVQQQKEIGAQRPNLVSEGRDQGTVVFADAALKFYLDATPAERARRRAIQLRSRGEIVDVAQLQREIVERDTRDATRDIGPLIIPAGATVIDTTHLSQQQVIEEIVAHSRRHSPK